MSNFKNKVKILSLLLSAVLVLTFCEKKEQNNSDIELGTTYNPDYRIEKKEEIVMVYITSPGCGICTLQENIEVVKQIKSRLEKKADSLELGFMTIGISNSWVIEKGYSHLEDYGPFDEVLIGNNWFGTGTMKYIFGEFAGTPAVPSLILTKRVYGGSNNDSTFIARGVEDEQLVRRMFGIDKLREWLDQGLPLASDI